jgi:hypothetical protein
VVGTGIDHDSVGLISLLIFNIFLRDIDKENEKLIRVCLDVTVNLCKLNSEGKKLQNELEKEKVVEQGKKTDVKNIKKDVIEPKKGITGESDKKLKILTDRKPETKSMGAVFVEEFKVSVLNGLATSEINSEVTSPSVFDGGFFLYLLNKYEYVVYVIVI